MVVIDVDPDEFNTAYQEQARADALNDRRGGGHIWTIWRTMILGFDAT